MDKENNLIQKLKKLEQPVLYTYTAIIHIAFNIAILILIFSLGVGIWKTIAKLSLTFTESTVRLSFKELVTNVLSLIVVLELIRAFVDYFEHERVRIEILLEVLLAFIIREFMIHVFEAKIQALEVLLWSLGIVAIVISRTLAVIYRPDKEKNVQN
jgi:uncharacterized membrane protein (DUF373 family)